MKYRKLRIAWSVGCGIACVLLIVVWIRSYSWMDAVPRLHIASADGKLYIRQNLQVQPGSKDDRFRHGIISMSLDGQRIVPVGPPGTVLPAWVVEAILVTLSISPHVRRFSLRALLIAMTLIAVLLGLIVWLSHR